MILVQKDNKQLRVSQEQLPELLRRGFRQVDEKSGRLLVTEPADQIRQLKKENAALKKALDAKA